MNSDHDQACRLSAEKLQQLVREHHQRPLPRRFYRDVSVEPLKDGRFAVLLDGRPLRTPLKHPLHLPNAAVAEAVAEEWRAQEERINPAAMPITGLANAAIDKADRQALENERDALQAHLAELAAHDLLCYRADENMQGGLAERQRRHWDAPLRWAEERLGARLQVAQGIMPLAQPRQSIAALLAPYEKADPFTFIALFSMATLTRSVVVPLAVLHQQLDADAAWHAATLEEQWNMERWGKDAQAAASMAQQRAEFMAAARFLSLLEQQPGQ